MCRSQISPDIFESQYQGLSSMQTDPKFEVELLRGIARLLDNQETSLPHWRTAGRALVIAGIALSGLSVIGESTASVAGHLLLLASLLAGLCIGTGLWVLAFTKQWPVLSKYMDREAIRRRASEPDA